MPKIKSNRSAAKRFKITGTGKIKYERAGASHLLSKKTSKRKRNLRKVVIIDKTQVKAIKRMIPYA